MANFKLQWIIFSDSFFFPFTFLFYFIAGYLFLTLFVFFLYKGKYDLNIILIHKIASLVTH